MVVENGADHVLLSVIDSGPGIPEAERERIFERFHRLESHEGQPGLGLGLSIVRGLVRAIGGDVWIEDAAGGGAAVCVLLPTAHEGREAV